MRDAKIPFTIICSMFYFFTNKTSEIHDDDKFPPFFPTIYVKIINIYEIEIVVEKAKTRKYFLYINKCSLIIKNLHF